MGFSSSNCEGCEHPLLSERATNEINAWMTQSVAITENGSIIKGSYDGFGNIGNTEEAVYGNTVWHEACWLAAGLPTDFRGESEASYDQGWYFEDPVHDMAAPAPAPSAVDVLRNALQLILDQTLGRCSRSTTPIGACFLNGQTADAKYGDDMACTSCIAHAALSGLPIPLGPGPHAIDEIPANQQEQS